MHIHVIAMAVQRDWTPHLTHFDSRLVSKDKIKGITHVLNKHKNETTLLLLKVIKE